MHERIEIMKAVRFLVAAILLALVGSSPALALPAQASVHAQVSSSQGSSHSTAAQANAQTHLAAAQLQACQNRENVIKTIMSRIDTRAQNQIALFGTIATRVEALYVKQGKTFSNYDQLVAAVNAAQAQANSDFKSLSTNTSFNCTGNDPKGMVSSFQGYLKLEITDLQSYRTAVKNLIVGVAQAQGQALPALNQTTTGGQ